MDLDLGVHSTPEGLVDLTGAQEAGDRMEVAPGLIVENPPEDPAELAAVLGRHGLGLDVAKGRRR